VDLISVSTVAVVGRAVSARFSDVLAGRVRSPRDFIEDEAAADGREEPDDERGDTQRTSKPTSSTARPYFWNKVTEEAVRKRGILQQAIERPKHALYSRLADTYILSVSLPWFHRLSPMASKGGGHQALEIDNKLGDAHHPGADSHLV
jgi:hypothetical protein